MSTTGSAHKGSDAAAYSAAGGAPTGAPPARRPAFFRWRGIFALLFFTGIACAGWLLFGDLAIKSAVTEAATKSLGVQVDIRDLDLSLSGATLDLRDLAVAHPVDPATNIIEVGHARVALDGRALLRKKIVIQDLTIDSVRGLTRRAEPAKVVAAGGFLPGALREANRWSSQFKVPLLSLTPIDTIRSLILDPGQLQTVQQARVLAAQADAFRDGATARFRAIRFAETADSAESLLARLKGQTPRSLGITGARTAVADVRRLAARIDSTKRSLELLRASLSAGADTLVESAKALDDARQADYAFARGLLKLPTFDAPNIGPALFGQVSLDAFEKAMYWVALARDYAPPGLLPRETSGPERLRRSGTTLHFVERQRIPSFHLRRAAVNLELDAAAGALRGSYALRIADVTSDPAIVKRPTAFSLTRDARGGALESLLIVGTLDHTGARQTENIVLRAGGVTLPGFALPAVPLRLDLGKGGSTLRFNVVGDSVSGRWTVAAPGASWSPDPARQRPMNTLESLVSRVLTSIDSVDVSADIRGTTKAPALSVRSNLDRAVADNIKRVAGEEIAKAEAKVRAQVDAFVERETAPVKAKITQVRGDVDQRIAEASTRVDKAKADLAARLRELSGGLIGG